MARYDKEQVKQAAVGRWPEILARLANVSIDILDSKHHPCPKCGGEDRFRAFDDFDQSGGLICNQCFSHKNGDGFSSLEWLTGKPFAEVLVEVAKVCNVPPLKGKGADPAEHLEFLPWNQTLIGLWCKKKKPITPDAVKLIGGRMARYREQYTVIAFPVWGPALNKEPAVGWVLYRADGGMLPKYKKGSAKPEWVKVKLTAGSKKGIITRVLEDGTVVINGTQSSNDLEN